VLARDCRVREKFLQLSASHETPTVAPPSRSKIHHQDCVPCERAAGPWRMEETRKSKNLLTLATLALGLPVVVWTAFALS